MAGEIRLGTSSFTADGWNGVFYPKGMRSANLNKVVPYRDSSLRSRSESGWVCPLLTAICVNLWRCPRCGEWYSATWWYNLGFLGTRCVHSGLRKCETGHALAGTRQLSANRG